jgi:GNAT superfamily N-acetyltransferase
MDSIIREMKYKDIEAVQKVAEQSWNDTYEGIIPRDIQKRFLESAYSKEMMEKRLETSYLYVVESKAEIAGFANFSQVKVDGNIELGAIYLLPEMQGMGLGTKLLKKAVESIEGIKMIFINVEEENLKGRVFYQNKGFDPLSKFEDDLFGHKTMMLRMLLKLDDHQPGGMS